MASSPEPGRFLLTVCQVGAERALKDEIRREHPSLHPAFGRPGLVTFKNVDGVIDPRFVLRSVFARAWAIAIGPARSMDEVLVMADSVRADKSLRLHVWDREPKQPGDETAVPESSPNASASAIREELRAVGGARFLDGEEARAGEHVLDVVVPPGEPHFVAHHLHDREHSRFPGGLIPIEMPPEAPSRAYRKAEEALAWSGAPIAAGQTAVEIGSAPGGASYALLKRGLNVVGVDPGAMAPIVLSSPRFRHVAAAVADARIADLPSRVDWLFLDVNLAPQVALHSVRGLVAAFRSSLRGVLFTLKLNDWSMAAKVPDLVRRVREMGAREVRATQLPSNRQEIFVYGVFT